MAVICATGWNGTVNGGKWSNHESNLGEDEMKALGESIINLAEMGNLPALTPQCFKDLAKALTSGTVTITKGIHQRDSKVHFDVKSSIGVTGTFHVFVKTGEAANVMSPAIKAGWGVAPSKVGKTVPRTFFQYSVSGLSYSDGKIYPPLFATLSEVEKPLGRARGSSFCQGNQMVPPTRSEITEMAA